MRSTPKRKRYPREDKCRVCGAHIGFILHPIAEALALFVCDKRDHAHKSARKEAKC